MKRFLLTTMMVFGFCTSAFADLVPVPADQAPAVLKSLSLKIYSYIETQKPKNCIMPDPHSLGILYEKNAQPRSTDYFFAVPAGASLEILVSKESANNSYLIEQVWPFGRQHQLLVSLDMNDEVIGVEATLNSASADPQTVKCGQ